MKLYSAGSLAVVGMAALCGGGAATAQTVQVSVGGEYSVGSYGGSGDTTIYEAPVTFRVRAGDWSFRVRVPFASIEGPGGVIPGGADDNGGDRSGPGGGDDTEDDPIENDLGEVIGGVKSEGLADISLSATYSMDIGDDNYLDLTGRVTLPTGDETRDLGTGETDATIQAEFGHDFDGAGLYVYGGYKFRGGDTREDGAQFGGGGYFEPMTGVIAGLDAGWSESSLNGLDQSADLTAYGSFAIDKDWRLSLYALTGLTDNAPDFGAGFTLTWRADFRRPNED